jgi:hypothetical protein
MAYPHALWQPSRRAILQTVPAILSAAPLAAAAQRSAPNAGRPPRNLLAKHVTPEVLRSSLLPREKWHPWPTAAERDPWEGLPTDVRKRILAAGEGQLKREWAILPATVFLEFKRIGNRSHYEQLRDARRARLLELTLAECVEGKGRFLDEIVNGLWLTCEETYWGLPAHLYEQKAGPGLPDVTEPIVELFAAETSAQIAWTLYLLAPALDKVSPMVTPRLYYEMDRHVLTPNRERSFGFMGLPRPGRPAPSLNNWTPWICSNWLTTALIAERDAARRTEAVGKIVGCLDRFLNGYADDGGCDEGPGYWNAAGGALFDNLELLRSASNGTIDCFGEPLVKEIGRYIYRAHIAGDYFTNFSDAPAKVSLSADMVYRFGKRIGDEKMMALGAWSENAQAHGRVSGGSLGRQLPALFEVAMLREQKAEPPYLRDVWLPGIGVMAARQREGSTDGMYVAAEAGHNAKSHNHNDVGNFIVFANGKPAIIDVGVETYSATTFGAHRYEIWTMQSAFHNCPTIGGVMQNAGRQYAATEVSYHGDDAAAELAMNIEHAYPAEAGLKTWHRTVRFDRKKQEVEIRDRYALERATGEILLTLMTPCKAQVSATGELTLQPAGVKVLFDGAAFHAVTEEIAIEDGHLRGSWGDKLYRVLLKCEKPPMEADWRIRIVMA